MHEGNIGYYSHFEGTTNKYLIVVVEVVTQCLLRFRAIMPVPFTHHFLLNATPFFWGCFLYTEVQPFVIMPVIVCER